MSHQNDEHVIQSTQFDLCCIVLNNECMRNKKIFDKICVISKNV